MRSELTRLVRTVAGCLAAGLCVCSASVCRAAEIDTDRYAPLQLTQLQATPEKYKNDRVVYNTQYNGFQMWLPQYVERSGFKLDKHFYLRTLPVNLPVMAAKKDFADAITTLARGSAVKVYGKVKRFSSSPKEDRFPMYYLDLEHLEIISKGELKETTEAQGALRPRRGVRRRPVRRRK